MTSELVVQDLVKVFGGIRAIDGCSFTVRSGSITGIIGPNGAGKSTLFNVISGVLPSQGGHIWLDGRPIEGLAPHQIARLGIARSFQTPREVPDATTLSNMMLVPQDQWGERLSSLFFGWGRIRHEEGENRAASLKALRQVEIEHQNQTPAGNLSIGQKKLLELARCLLGRPKIALLDEPTAGVNPRLVGDLIATMHEMSKAGVTLMIIEHNMNVVMNLCEQIVVMNRGKVLRQGTPPEIQNDPVVQDAYLGAAV
jgi:branched-chain amino acid transport system ATP-binding protein